MCAYSSAGWQRVLSGWVGGEPHVRLGSIFNSAKGHLMNNIVYIVGAVVIIIALLSFFGLR
jgi:hypothetical protein